MPPPPLPRSLSRRFAICLLLLVSATTLLYFLFPTTLQPTSSSSGRFFGYTYGYPPPPPPPPIPGWQDDPPTLTEFMLAPEKAPATTTPCLTTSGSGPEQTAGVPKTLEDLRRVVQGTQGYYVRDWSLWLGWNNMRYIIETALNQATLLNRTLVLPSFVYARDCEFHHSVCSNFADVVNRAESGSNEWRNLPLEDQEGWRIPISIMFDYTHLLTTHPVILMSDFLALHSLPPSLERPNGQFDPDALSSLSLSPSSLELEDDTPLPPPLSLAHIPNEDYDTSIVRIDRMPPPPPNTNTNLNETLRTLLHDEFGTAQTVSLIRLRQVLMRNLYPMPEEEKLYPLLKEYGLEVVYQYQGRSLDMTKSVAMPYAAVVNRTDLRGFVDDYGGIKEDVLWLGGEIHAGRRPGSMWFSTAPARDDYTRLVLQTMRPPPAIPRVAERLAKRMRERARGNMWMAAHMRRGDFVTVTWALKSAFDKHFERIMENMDRGRQLLKKMKTFNAVNTAPVPDVKPFKGFKGMEPPNFDDPFYLATDERDPDLRDWLRDQGAILIDDLLTQTDRQDLGAASVLTDYISLLEQALMSRAAYWVGHATTSVSGGVANMRAALGMDQRTTVLDS